MSTRLLVIDTETSGLDPARHALLSLAGVVWEDGRQLDELELFVFEPQIECDPESMAINGIDLEWLAEHGLPPRAAIRRLEDFLGRRFDPAVAKVPLAGHNVGFDIPFLKQLFARAGAPYGDLFSHRVLDTAGIVRFLALAGRLPLEGAGLTAALDHFGIEVPGRLRHSALGDARATAELLSRLVGLVGASRAAPGPLER